jgi:phosphohistidine phosphatase
MRVPCIADTTHVLTLYITRHAKSSWSDPQQSDFDRPINERGARNAPYMAGVFKQRGEPVDLIVTSTAARALATARIFASQLGFAEADLVRMDKLYHATVPTLIDVIRKLPKSAKRVMLFGHNPGLTELVDYLSSEDIGNLPTCGTVRIDIPMDDWELVSRDLGTLVWMDYPKRHAGQG